MLTGAFVAGIGAAAFTAWTLHRLRLLSRLLAARDEELRALRESQAQDETRYRIVTDNATDVIVHSNCDFKRLYVSPSCLEVTGYSQQELLHGCAFAMVHPDDLPPIRELFASFGPDNPVHDATWRLRRKDGRYVWIEARYRYLPNDGGLVAVLRDVDGRKRAEERLAAAKDRLEHLAMHDALTGLPNRRSFLELLERSLHVQPAQAVLFIDLDRFKPVNDVHGHGVGDAILIEVAARIRTVLGTDAAIVARIGGDEFAALLPAPQDDAAVAATARAVVAAISAPLRIGGMTIDVGAAVGISVSPRNGTDTASLLRTADIAMYHAKRAGGGSHRFFEARMASELEETTELKQELRHAMVAGEVVPYFQPLVRMRDQAIVGFEALARWEHPTKGTLTPNRFMPIVKQCGLSGVLFETVLRQACLAASAWPSHLRLAVNIAPPELQDAELPRRVAAVLEAAGVAADRLEIEITETALIHDAMVPRSVLAGLRKLGCRIALDDFGRGYSNLFHLRELRFDRISIDRAFTLQMGAGCGIGDYMAALVQMGQAIGMELTAKGIEDASALARLRELGCAYGQGFLFSRPLRPEHAAELAMRTTVVELAGPAALLAASGD